MPLNVEIKARVKDLEALERWASRIADDGPTLLEQEDVFFETRRGRLKLRLFREGDGELIYYERADTAEPAASRYSRIETSDPEALRALLSRALGTRGTVRKRRRVYIMGQTRIHLDRVEGLGDFMELEVVLRPDQSVVEGTRIAKELMESLGIAKEQLIDTAYIDLFSNAGGRPKG